MTVKDLSRDEALLIARQSELTLLTGCDNPKILNIGISAIKGEEPAVRIAVRGENTDMAEKYARKLHRNFDGNAERLGLQGLSARPEIRAVPGSNVSAACHLHG